MKITRIMQSPAIRVWVNGEGYVVKTPSVPMEVTIQFDENRLFTMLGNRAWANSGKKSSECKGIIMTYAKPAEAGAVAPSDKPTMKEMRAVHKS